MYSDKYNVESLSFVNATGLSLNKELLIIGMPTSMLSKRSEGFPFTVSDK
ncbi:hypothetical protein FM120_23385 [Sphingobacterium faecium PCAi_F2.5]|nr:hypothetical protein FM120_23385 [Sphingobacterium faecium PCAi_F2.5]